jgi:MarR family transcriptional regulator, organic hydroperoxide resistance regulator
LYFNSNKMTTNNGDNFLLKNAGCVSRAFNIALGRLFVSNGYNITVEKWSVLVALIQKDNQFQYELAVSTGRDRPSLTRLIDQMEKQGLVLRKSEINDRRINSVHLTNEARDLYFELEKLYNELTKMALKNIDQTDLDCSLKVMDTINRNLS